MRVLVPLAQHKVPAPPRRVGELGLPPVLPYAPDTALGLALGDGPEHLGGGAVLGDLCYDAALALAVIVELFRLEPLETALAHAHLHPNVHLLVHAKHLGVGPEEEPYAPVVTVLDRSVQLLLPRRLVPLLVLPGGLGEDVPEGPRPVPHLLVVRAPSAVQHKRHGQPEHRRPPRHPGVVKLRHHEGVRLIPPRAPLGSLPHHLCPRSLGVHVYLPPAHRHRPTDRHSDEWVRNVLHTQRLDHTDCHGAEPRRRCPAVLLLDGEGPARHHGVIVPGVVCLRELPQGLPHRAP
mmetsp:Transcript_8923/g.21905  ORF Transcript_8923/g.21905 Transcript_8923/m.21905 type:complete len:292 (-) Transcript_8923:1997-2872(-)